MTTKNSPDILRHCDNRALAEAFLANKAAFAPSDYAKWMFFMNYGIDSAEIQGSPQSYLGALQRNAYDSGQIRELQARIYPALLDPAEGEEAIMELSAVVGGEKKAIRGRLVGFTPYLKPVP
jgi:hypothetical protein